MARYWVTGGDGNWGSTNNWSTTSNGAGGSSVPTTSDDVFFDAFSPACTVNTSTRVGLSINFTGYTDTITMTFGITVNTSMTFSSGMTIAGAGFFTSQAVGGTHTSNGILIPNLSMLSVVTHTLADNFSVTNLTIGTASSTTTVNGNSISVAGNFTMGGSSGGVIGTTAITMTGTGTLTWPSTTGALRNPFTINTAGTITVVSASGFIRYNTGTFTYTAGTFDISAFELTNSTLSTTYDLPGRTVAALTLTAAGGPTVTFSNDLIVTGLAALGTSTGTLTVNGANLLVYGGLQGNLTTGQVSGTTVINLKGTGTLSTPAHTTGRFLNQIQIDAGSGTITCTTPCRLEVGQLKYVSGTVITDAGTWATGGSSGGGQIPIRYHGVHGVGRT